MARCLFLFLAVGLVVGAVQAQPEPVRMGVSAGGIMSAQNAVPEDEDVIPSPRYGMGANLFITVPLRRHVQLRAGSAYLSKGYRRDGQVRRGVQVGEGTQIVRARIFSIRSSVEVGFSRGKGEVYGLTGPRLDVLVGDESEFLVDGERVGFLRGTDVSYAPFTFGVLLGMGGRFDAGLGEALQIEVVADRDVTGAYSREELRIRRRSFVLSAGILF